ncbi:MAG: septum formation protein Maf [Sphingobacteriales bacterium 40-81]|nr:MAG: septum formation protein Maf [Sphingobacteriales bacterium 40-81]
MTKVILASQSPRRKQLLEWAAIDFDIIVRSTDESYPAGLSPAEVAIYIAEQKNTAVRNSDQFKLYAPATPVITADTIVVCNDLIIGKPEDRNDAIHILQTLSGKKHLVITGVVITSGGKTTSFADATEVWFHPLTNAQIEFYIDNYKPYDKAGAYAIQEWIGVVGIEKINGDFYNVMGLPVSRVVRELGKI